MTESVFWTAGYSLQEAALRFPSLLLQPVPAPGQRCIHTKVWVQLWGMQPWSHTWDQLPGCSSPSSAHTQVVHFVISATLCRNEQTGQGDATKSFRARLFLQTSGNTNAFSHAEQEIKITTAVLLSVIQFNLGFWPWSLLTYSLLLYIQTLEKYRKWSTSMNEKDMQKHPVWKRWDGCMQFFTLSKQDSLCRNSPRPITLVSCCSEGKPKPNTVFALLSAHWPNFCDVLVKVMLGVIVLFMITCLETDQKRIKKQKPHRKCIS